MRILQVAASVTSNDGGSAEAILAINRELTALGHEVVLMTTDADGPSHRLTAGERQRVMQTHQLTMHRSHPPRRLKASVGLLVDVLRHASDYDIAHVHGLYLAHDLTAALAQRVGGLPYVVHLHGVLEPYQRQQNALAKRFWDMTVGHVNLNSAAGFITAAESEREGALEVLPADKPVYVIGLGAGVGEVETPPIGWNLPKAAPFVLYFGRFARKKRPDLLLEAWAEQDRASVGEAVLVLAGPNGEWTRRQLMSLAETLGVSDRTLVLPLQAGPSKTYLLRRAALFVLASENENFAIAVAEALAHGTAVLTTEHVAAASHVLSAEAGTVLTGPVSTKALSDALRAYLAEPERSRDEGLRGAAYAAKHLSWTRTAVQLVDIYEQHRR